MRRIIVAVALLAAGIPTALASTDAGATSYVVFNSEDNRFNAYGGSSGAKQTVIPSAGDVLGTTRVGLDINAQICLHTFNGKRYFIAGEDTAQRGAGGSPGWGWFELTGSTVGELSAIEHGKLIPTWTQPADQENYGCGFLADGRLLLSDVGAQLPHEPASGQLHIWYPDPLTGFDDPTHVDVANGTGPVDVLTTDDPETDIDNRTDGAATGQRYCKIDTSIGTAGGVMVDGDWAYVASSRPDTNPPTDESSGDNGPGGIYRYEIADFPAAGTDCGGHGDQADLVALGVVDRELWLPSDPFVLTPSAIVRSGRTFAGNPTYYVSSVFTGVIAEYADVAGKAVHVRNVVEPPGGAPIGQLDDNPFDGTDAEGTPIDEIASSNDGGTPYGMGVGSDGNLWYADLGIQGDGPATGHGSVQRVAFDSQGNVTSRFVVDDGLTYPDGIGILELGPIAPNETDGGPPGVGDRKASSDAKCEWSTYGHGVSRDFAVPDDCDSPIEPTTAPRLVRKWQVKTEKTVTASPAVFGGRVYAGDWSGTMYAVDAESGAERWTFDVAQAPGAAFGPIVSSAAVTEVDFGRKNVKDTRRLVIFGAGPRLYALHDQGIAVAAQWVRNFDENPETPETFVEIESSPVVWKGVVYVGLGNHNHGGTGVPGGLLALDAKTGATLWKFEPELGADAGCGTVWSSPTIDPGGDGQRPLVYLATGNCSSDTFEWNRHTEAVTALDARTGEVVWAFQPHVANHRDWDFGATPNLFTVNGRKVLGVGNKDGVYYALDARTGALLWNTKVAEPGDVQEDFSIGGYLGSSGAYGGRVFGGTAIGGPPYYHALNGTDGAIAWRGAQAPTYAASAAVNGVVFAPALDSVIRAYDLATGLVLWASPLLGPGSSGPAIVGDSVYVGSGTSSSDACAKELPINQQCLALFDQVLGGLGGIEAFELVL